MKVAAIDQGTTSTKAYTLDADGRFVAAASFEQRQIYPQPGWVEHDARELLQHVRSAIAAAGRVDAIGLANQGETVIAWDARTGEPIYNAIVWQDDRTKDVTARLKAEGAERLTLERAGLPLDPYFSASKLRWLLDYGDAPSLLRQGRLRLGTSDAYFLDRLTGTFATDVTTASRTSLMSLDTLAWDEELCRLFGVPPQCLPEIRSSAGSFGAVDGTLLSASLVDQQAALFGHGCAQAGEAKITFGTGAFALALCGEQRPLDPAGVAPTLAWKIGTDPVAFALEGGVYNAGSALNWVRGLGLFNDYAAIDAFDSPPAIERGLVFVPALSGLACPHWDRNAAGMWLGMDLATGAGDLVQSVLEGIALRAAEVVAAINRVIALREPVSIDGGLANNSYFVRFLANALGMRVRVPASVDLTALGTARMSMLGAGLAQLPPHPAPLREIAPERALRAETKARYSEAVRRARDWRRNA